MSLGPIRLSSEVGKGAAAPSSAGRISIRTPHLEAGRPFDGAAAAGRAYQQLGAALDRRRERKVEEVSAETAQRVQSAMSEKSIRLYDRKEKDAAGIVDDWDAECQKAVKEAGANLDPDTRKAFERRMAPWMAGRRENLMEHQFREVRRGRVNALENDMRSTAAAETNDILALTASEQEDWNARLASGTKPEDIAAERDTAFDTHFKQMMAVQQATETRYADAAQQGLYGAEEAKSRCLKSRHDAARTILDSAIESGNADFAEYTLNRLAEGKGKDTVAARCGLSAEELSSCRSAIQRVRDRKAAEAKREAAEREETSKTAAREKEVGLHLRSIPQDDAGQTAYFERMAVDYAELANDPTLPADTRLAYAKTARALGFQSLESKASAARQQKASEREAKAERREQERERLAAVRQTQDDTFAIHESDFLAGGYFDAEGNWIDHTAETMRDTANRCLADGKLSRVQWHRLMTMQQKQYGDEMNDFRNLVMAEIKGLIPSCVTWRRNRFELQPNNKVNGATQTARRGGEDEDKVTYRQLVEAMNLTRQWWQLQGKGASISDAKKHFDELTQGLVRGRMQRNIDTALEEEKQLINDWRMTNGR